MEEPNGGTNKANVVSKPNQFNGKNKKNKKKNTPRILWAPAKIKNNSKARKGHILCVENLNIMLGSVGTEGTKKGL